MLHLRISRDVHVGNSVFMYVGVMCSEHLGEKAVATNLTFASR